MSKKEPMDLALARRAYGAYWNEQPQVWFDDLQHSAQMRWVNAVRAVRSEVKKLNAQHARDVHYGRAEPRIRTFKHPKKVRDAWAKAKRDRSKTDVQGG